MKVSNTKISFMGNPIAWDWGGRFASLAARRDIQSIGFAVAASELCLNIGILSIHEPPSLKGAVAVGTFIGLHNIQSLFMSYLFEESAMRKIFSKDIRKNKCIDTKPDNRIPPNIDQWGVQAARMRKHYAFGAIVVSGFCIATGGIYLLASAPLLVRQLQGRKRWSNVESGEWRISDKGPPSEPVRQVTTANVPALGKLALVPTV